MDQFRPDHRRHFRRPSMNDVTQKELKIVVEQTVRPVRATLARKRKMREELLAHLMAIFDEEAERLGDEQAALEQAKQRFGDPGELTTQLQQSVPRWDRCRSILENMGYRSSESAWHLAAKHFLAMLLIYLLWLPTWMLASGSLRHLGPVELRYILAFVLAGAVLVTALFNVILSIVLAPLLYKIGPVLASNRWRRFLLAMLCGFVVLCGLVLPAFTGAAVLFILMARQAVKEWRYEADWA
jgi:hypothetical protein